MWTVQVTRPAQKDLDALPAAAYRTAERKLDQLADDPFAAGFRKLNGAPERWRARIGDYRIVAALDQAAQIATVLRIQHRKDVYR